MRRLAGLFAAYIAANNSLINGLKNKYFQFKEVGFSL